MMQLTALNKFQNRDYNLTHTRAVYVRIEFRFNK